MKSNVAQIIDSNGKYLLLPSDVSSVKFDEMRPFVEQLNEGCRKRGKKSVSTNHTISWHV